MRRLIVTALILLSISSVAYARKRCSADVEPMLSVHFIFIRDVTDDATAEGHFTTGELLVSKGGAVTLMRTDTECCAPAVRSFVTGRLEQQQLERLQRALDHVLAGGPVDCFVPGFDDPRPGQSTFGGSELTIYRGGSAPLRFNVQHSDPDVPVPQCVQDVALLDTEVIALEDALRHGALPLQCVPYRSPGS